MIERSYHKRNNEDVIRMARTFDEYHTCFRNFVSKNPERIRASLDRGTLVYPLEMYRDGELDMLGSKRSSRSFSYGPEEGDIKVREKIAEKENQKEKLQLLDQHYIRCSTHQLSILEWILKLMILLN